MQRTCLKDQRKLQLSVLIGGDLRESKQKNESEYAVSHFPFKVLANSGYVLKLYKREKKILCANI